MKFFQKIRFLSFVLFFLLQGLIAQSQEENVPHKTGMVTISGTVNSILGEEVAKNYSEIVDIDEILRWQLFVPESYQADVPIGMFYNSYFTNSSDFAIGWKKSFEDKNLIGINRIFPKEKDGSNHNIHKILSFVLIQNLYNVNTNRIYIATNYYGCMETINAALTYPNIIKGVIFDQCRRPVRILDSEKLNNLVLKNRFVFLSTSRSMEGFPMRRAYRSFKKAGISSSKHLEYPVGRTELRGSYLNQAIDFLDNPSEQ